VTAARRFPLVRPPPSLSAAMREATGRCEGRKPLAETHKEAAALARSLRRKRKGRMSLRAVAAELAAQGHLNELGRPFNPKSVVTMLRQHKGPASRERRASERGAKSGSKASAPNKETGA
jgi:hypothetical protein